MRYGERARLLELRETGPAVYEWVPVRELRMQVVSPRRLAQTREEARQAPVRFRLPPTELEIGRMIVWRERFYELCQVLRFPGWLEVVAAPVMLTGCRLWKLASGEGPDGRPLRDLVDGGRFPGTLSEVQAQWDGEPVALRFLSQRAVLAAPEPVALEAGDIVEAQGMSWTVLSVDPFHEREVRCELGRKVNV